AELLARAEAADAEPLPEGLNLPEELARREARLEAIGEAKAEISTNDGPAQHLRRRCTVQP
ncbi:MAG: hypothetical protein M3461_01920, partial [Pseudomonadota bacterium]|nr:hypothetical protein [Pseudomonadota bacterium]